MREDVHIITALKNVKAEYDKQKARKHLTEDEKKQIAAGLSCSTLDLAPKNWKKVINAENNLRAAWRREKIAFLEDYIGEEATRRSRMSASQGFVMLRRMHLESQSSEHQEREGEGMSSNSSPLPSWDAPLSPDFWHKSHKSTLFLQMFN